MNPGSEVFEETGHFIAIVYNSEFGLSFLNSSFLEVLHTNYAGKNCIVMENVSGTVYELETFYNAWKRAGLQEKARSVVSEQRKFVFVRMDL